jgi:hypothetical protein
MYGEENILPDIEGDQVPGTAQYTSTVQVEYKYSTGIRNSVGLYCYSAIQYLSITVHNIMF